jgi:hypothetical protein
VRSSATGSLTYEVLCAASSVLNVAVPGAYGTETAFHACVPADIGFVKTSRTPNAMPPCAIPAGAPCGGGT